MIRVEKLIPGGMGLGTDKDGKKIFFWNALPGEVVADFQPTKTKSHFTEAIVLKIINSSYHRIIPKDACYLSTSPWQIMDYPFELMQKRELVTEIFREHQIPLHELPEIITDGRDYFYRNKMEYALYWNNETNKIELAFHTRGSHRKLPIKNSSIERPEIFTHAQEIINDLNVRGEQARKYQSLLLRCDQSGKVSGGLYENKKPHPHFETLSDKILDQTYFYSPNGFFQINLPVYKLVLSEIKNHITTDSVLDLYAGVGTIGLSVAHNCKLTLVEVDKFAFSELEKNCQQFKNNSINPILDKSENVLNYIKPDQTVILDPPRAGCDRKLINKILETKPQKIIYLSCNPATQARDVKMLLEKYHLESIRIYNFFPRTPHIENLVVLSL